jgi:hypothetical protein
MMTFVTPSLLESLSKSIKRKKISLAYFVSMALTLFATRYSLYFPRKYSTSAVLDWAIHVHGLELPFSTGYL